MPHNVHSFSFVGTKHLMLLIAHDLTESLAVVDLRVQPRHPLASQVARVVFEIIFAVLSLLS